MIEIKNVIWSEPETLRSKVVGERLNSVDMRSIIEGVILLYD